MAAFNPVELRIIIDAQNKASAVLTKARKDIDKLGKGMVATGAASGTMTAGLTGINAAALRATAGVAALSAGITTLMARMAVPAMVVGGFGAMAKGGALLQTRITSLVGTYDEALARMRMLTKESKGAFSMPELVDAESKIAAFDMELRLTPKILQNIQGRAAQMGITTTKALDDIILGLARGSRKILDNVGLVVSLAEANRQYSIELGKSVNELTDAERRAGFLKLAMKELEKTTMSTTSAYGASLKATAILKDAWAELKLATAPLMLAMEPLAGIIADIANVIAILLGGALRVIVPPLTAVFNSIGKLTSAIKESIAAVMGFANIIVKHVFGALGKWFEKYSGIVKLTEEAIKEFDELAAATKRMMKAQESWNDRVAESERAWRKLGAEVRTYVAFVKDFLTPETIKITDLQLKELNLIKSVEGSLTKSQKARRTQLLILKAETEATIQLNKASEEYEAQWLSTLRSSMEGALTLAEVGKSVNDLRTGYKDKTEAIRANLAASIQLAIHGKKTTRTLKAQKASVDSLAASWFDAHKELNEFLRAAHKLTTGRMFSIRDETAAIGDRVDILKLEKNMRAAGDPAAKAKIEHQIRMNELQQDFNDKIKHMDPVVRLAAHDELTQMFDLLKGEELERFKKQLDDIDAARAAHSIRQMNDAFRGTAAVMQSISPPMAIAQAAIGNVASTWATFAVDTQKSGGKIAGAIGASLGSIGPAAAAFVEDQKKQAAIMAAFEVAMGIAAAVTPGQGPGVAAAHFAAAAMFGIIAATGIGTKSSKARGGAGAAGLPGGGMVPPPQEGPKQIVINFTDGMVLGDAQSLAKKINQTIDQASGTGTPSAA